MKKVRTDAERLAYNARQAAYMKKYRANASPEQRELLRAQWRRYANTHPAKLNAKAVRLHVANRAAVIAKYGGACTCCGENQPEFLTIDHIVPLRLSNKQGRIPTRSHYLKLKREPVNPGIQVLCFNCNHAKGTSAGCPHRKIYERHFVLLRGSL